MAETVTGGRAAAPVAGFQAAVGFQTVTPAEPVAETRPRRRPRVIKPVADEVDFQIAPASEPVPDAKTRRRPRVAAKPKTDAVAPAAQDGRPRRRAGVVRAPLSRRPAPPRPCPPEPLPTPRLPRSRAAVGPAPRPGPNRPRPKADRTGSSPDQRYSTYGPGSRVMRAPGP
ncbi:hypothetical protein NKH18_33765 [Streptomyces sp. M10(2022)]